MRGVVAIVVFVVAAGVVALTCAQPVPFRPDGHVLRGEDASVVLEVFMDLLCSDCKAVWPLLKKVSDHYGDNLQLRVHIYPLPYHQNAFLAAQASLVVEKLKGEKGFWSFVDAVFDKQEEFLNAATKDLTEQQVTEKLGALAGVSSKEFVAGMADGALNMAARVAWKYAVTRDTYGTPAFLLNGVPFQPNGFKYQDWIGLLDQFFRKKA